MICMKYLCCMVMKLSIVSCGELPLFGVKMWTVISLIQWRFCFQALFFIIFLQNMQFKGQSMSKKWIMQKWMI